MSIAWATRERDLLEVGAVQWVVQPWLSPVAGAMHRPGLWVGRGGLLEEGAVQKLCSPVATQYRAGRPACGGVCVGSVIGAYRALPVCVLVGIGRVSVCGVGVLGGLWPPGFVLCVPW